MVIGYLNGGFGLTLFQLEGFRTTSFETTLEGFRTAFEFLKGFGTLWEIQEEFRTPLEIQEGFRRPLEIQEEFRISWLILLEILNYTIRIDYALKI